MRVKAIFAVVLCWVLSPSFALAEVSNVSIRSRSTVANGQSFGTTGAYEKLNGSIEFALDPREPHNAHIADLDRAPRGADGRVHVTADLYILRPTDATKGNSVLLFEVSNRGHKGLLTRFNSALASDDLTAPAGIHGSATAR